MQECYVRPLIISLPFIGAGLRWAPVVVATAEHGLALITGSSTNVGTVGYTLGGGLGPLARSHGFATDWVRGFRVVTADGDVIVVDEMTLELVPMRTLFAGSLVFEGDAIEPAFRAWIDWSATLDLGRRPGRRIHALDHRGRPGRLR